MIRDGTLVEEDMMVVFPVWMVRLKLWMQQLNGWQRAWCVLVLTWLVVISATAWYWYPQRQQFERGLYDLYDPAERDRISAKDAECKKIAEKRDLGELEECIRDHASMDKTYFDFQIQVVQARVTWIDKNMDSIQNMALVKAFCLWIIPSGVVYLFGIAAVWIRRGFIKLQS